MSLRPRMALMLGVLALAVAVLCALGAWQVSRLFASREADASREARIAEPPVESPAPTTDPSALDYRRVRVGGRWDHEHTVLIANRSQYGLLGREAVTPLLPDGGGPAILVNRGWFPDVRQAEVLPALAAERSATVEGLARYVGKELLPGRKLPSGQWTRLDPAVMRGDLPYDVVAWQLVQGTRWEFSDERRFPATFPFQRYRVGGSTPPHLDYALTWFGLAIALVVIAGLRLRNRRTPADPPGVVDAEQRAIA